MGTFRILLADDHPVFRLGLRSLLGSHEGWEICGEANDGREAVEKCKQLKPEVLVPFNFHNSFSMRIGRSRSGANIQLDRIIWQLVIHTRGK
jgi:CheY-like chemotaxis protein